VTTRRVTREPRTVIAPDDERLAVWERFLRSHSMIIRQLERDLVEKENLSLAEYDVLAHLRHPPHRMRMTELAAAVLVTTGGITKLLDRMTAAGLVARERHPRDRRVVYAVLTDAGWQTLRRASATHLAGVQQHFASELCDDELDPVGSFLGRLVDRWTLPPRES